MSIRRRITRGAALAASTAALAAGAAWVGAGSAAAAPVPVLQILGNAIVPIPSGQCHGSIEVAYEHVPGRPDLAEAIFTPTGTWGAIPGCEVPVEFAWINGMFPFTHGHSVTVAGGRTSTIINPGAGVSLLVSVPNTGAMGAPSWGTSGYMWLQP
ncbi:MULTISPECIES: hypothetical protein [Rhodococcus]|uniref:hypothetical protein n=1 Tax=Rhodococcus TaxID=1827 RepID=UPI000B5A6EF5|nr:MULTISPECIES: hypothetical protein [Rhodococcus]MXQ76188.1 hypothetical protein [Rhodococcus rhodochrous]OWY79677.1 hypothetical protein B9C99_21470 [Rhodococcus sp. BUPNP1]BDB60513.1 hypothetical protein RDE2_23070 [Rhodococcus sp. RDE2]